MTIISQNSIYDHCIIQFMDNFPLKFCFYAYLWSDYLTNGRQYYISVLLIL